MWDPYAEFESATLPNGLDVHVAHWQGRPWVAMGFLIHTGAELDPVGFEGLAHFVEHLVSENAIIPQVEIRTLFEDRGGQVGLGSTGYACTSYGFFAPAEQKFLAQAFDIFGGMLICARIEKVVERERDVILGEMDRRYPRKYRFDLAMRERKAVYGNSCLARSPRPFGTPESVNRIQQSDLQLHYRRHYAPPNMSVVAVGGMTLKEIVQILSQSAFGETISGERSPLPRPETTIQPPSETRYIFEVSKNQEGSIGAGRYRTVAQIPGIIDPRILHIFSGMLNKILYEEVRNRRGWTYHFGSVPVNYRSFHEFSIEGEALALKAVDEIADVVDQCICLVEHRRDLFVQVKRCALACIQMMDSTGQEICGGALSNLATYHRILSLEEYGRKVEAVTMEDIHGLLQYLRPERRWTLIERP